MLFNITKITFSKILTILNKKNLVEQIFWYIFAMFNKELQVYEKIKFE